MGGAPLRPAGEWSGPEYTRREFLQKLGLGVGGLVVGVVATRYLSSGETVEKVLVSYPDYPRVRLANLKELQVGKPIVFDYPLKGQRSLLVKLGREAEEGVGPDRDVVAFSAFCSHMGMPMDSLFKADMGMLGPCPGHFTTFDLARSGMVVTGKATEHLPQIALEVDSAGDIFAVGTYGLIYGYRDNLLDGEPVGKA